MTRPQEVMTGTNGTGVKKQPREGNEDLLNREKSTFTLEITKKIGSKYGQRTCANRFHTETYVKRERRQGNVRVGES